MWSAIGIIAGIIASLLTLWFGVKANSDRRKEELKKEAADADSASKLGVLLDKLGMRK